MAYDYSHATWNGLPYDLREVPWEDVFKISACAAASEFVNGFRLELMYISLIISIRSGLTHLHGFQLLVMLPLFIEITFFFCTNRINPLNLKQSSDRLVIIAKGFLNLPNQHMPIKQEFITSQKLAFWNFYQIAYSVLKKGKSATPPLFNGPEAVFSAFDQAKLFAKNFSKNSNLDDSVMPLLVFPSRTNLTLHNISVTPKMVKKVIMILDLSKASGPDCLPVVVLKKCEPELSYIQA